MLHCAKQEKYGLVSDMRRAANSVTNNISEGFGRYEKLDKTRFYKISRGSCYELINQSLTSLIMYLTPSLKVLEEDKRNIITESNSCGSSADLGTC